MYVRERAGAVYVWERACEQCEWMRIGSEQFVCERERERAYVRAVCVCEIGSKQSRDYIEGDRDRGN